MNYLNFINGKDKLQRFRCWQILLIDQFKKCFHKIYVYTYGLEINLILYFIVLFFIFLQYEILFRNTLVPPEILAE